MNSEAVKRSAAAEGVGGTWWPDISLIGVATIWGVNIPIMKIGLEQVDVYVFNAIRLTISVTVLALFAWREKRTRRSSLRPTDLARIAVYALMIAVAYQLLFLWGIERTTAGNTALIIATVPIWTALLARVFLQEHLTRLAWSGLVVALLGTIVVAVQKGDVNAGAQHLLGNIIILLSAALWSVGTVYSRPLLRRLSPLQLSAGAAAMGLPVHLLLAYGQYQTSLPALESAGLWMIIIYAGVLSSGLSQPMWHFGVQHAGPAHASIIQNLIPLVALCAAWVFRGEGVTSAQLLGGALILGGLVTMRAGRQA